RLGAAGAERSQPRAPAGRHRVRDRARRECRRVVGGDMTFWRDHAVPPMRHEALYGDRIVRCFVDRPPGLYAMFEHARAARPEHEAMVCDGRRWSYAQLGAESERIAAGLAARGV